MDLKFSIGIPAFKGKFLRECIVSVLNQSVSNFELIIVNDCSPDNIDDIVKEFNDPRIMYSKNEKNLGSESVVKNWNVCLEKANGEYFVLLGDDDLLANDFLEEFQKLIRLNPDIDIYHCRSKIIDENSNPYKLTPLCNNYESVYDYAWHRISGYRLQFISDYVYRTSALRNIGGFVDLPLAWASDDLTAYELAKDNGIVYTSKPIFNYRQSIHSITSSGNSYIKMEALEIEERWWNEFIKHKPINDQDQLSLAMIQRSLPIYLKSRKRRTIQKSFFHGKQSGSVFFWFKKRSKYKISIMDIAISYLRFVLRLA